MKITPPTSPIKEGQWQGKGILAHHSFSLHHSTLLYSFALSITLLSLLMFGPRTNISVWHVYVSKSHMSRL